MAAQATTFVLPDEEGPGRHANYEVSQKSLLADSTFLPVPPPPPDARAALFLAGSKLRTGDVGLVGIRPGHGAPSAPLHQRVGSNGC